MKIETGQLVGIFGKVGSGKVFRNLFFLSCVFHDFILFNLFKDNIDNEYP